MCEQKSQTKKADRLHNVKKELNLEQYSRESTKMKKILNEVFSEGTFKVRKRSSNLHRSFTVYTDLFENPDRQRFRELRQEMNEGGIRGEKLEEYNEIEEQVDHDKELERKIKDLLRDWEEIRRDNATGEILSGGNSYLFVERLERLQ